MDCPGKGAWAALGLEQKALAAGLLPAFSWLFIVFGLMPSDCAALRRSSQIKGGGRRLRIVAEEMQLFRGGLMLSTRADADAANCALRRFVFGGRKWRRREEQFAARARKWLVKVLDDSRRRAKKGLRRFTCQFFLRIAASRHGALRSAACSGLAAICQRAAAGKLDLISHGGQCPDICKKRNHSEGGRKGAFVALLWTAGPEICGNCALRRDCFLHH